MLETIKRLYEELNKEFTGLDFKVDHSKTHLASFKFKNGKKFQKLFSLSEASHGCFELILRHSKVKQTESIIEQLDNKGVDYSILENDTYIRIPLENVTDDFVKEMAKMQYDFFKENLRAHK
jgi:hypothetical protein